jgi:ERCC4-related helicase
MSTMITELTEIDERNDILIKLIEKIVKDPSRHLLVLSDRRKHCFYLHEVFKNSSGLYLGGMKQKDLDESSKKKIIFATYSQAHEGLDIPSLNTLLLATPKSDIVQSIGRIMRGTKGSPVIYDIWDHWSVLHSMFYKRKKIYKEKNFNFEDDEPPPTPQLTGFAFQLNQ